jgi:CDP-diglyceride synthetase
MSNVQSASAPTVGPNKAIAAVIGGAVTTILVWVLNTYAHANIPAEIAGAGQTLITTALVYFVPHGGDA